MIHILTIREVIKSDLRAEYPYLPDEGEFEVYFSLLCQSVEQLECVDKIEVIGNSIHITLHDDFSFETLKDSVKPLTQGDFFEKLKVVSFA